jgi:hypothetical protein
MYPGARSTLTQSLEELNSMIATLPKLSPKRRFQGSCASECSKVTIQSEQLFAGFE